ncbi:hypothetical protein [Streptomyces sp. NBC_01014]|uniref:hypothetical protein n=1 Tax=Streptomyces sp. NBC_01014 TaxID=2903719 RepID=UPI003862F251|nr:hypothetical protein OG282_28860 [Streptomyces sp. NBC_01014]
MSTEARRAPFPSFPPRPPEPPSSSGPVEAPVETTTRLRPVVDAPADEPPAAESSAGNPPVAPGSPVEPGAAEAQVAAAPAVQPPARPPVPPRPTAPPPTRRRPVGAVDLTPRPGAGRPTVYAPPRPDAAETPSETTTRLRPVAARHPARTAAVAACAVLGLGLIGGAVAGSVLSGSTAAADSRTGFTESRGLWHSTPVDTLFPRTIEGHGAGPGGADRTWTRLAVAPDADCAGGLDPLLLRALQPVGCVRLLRATYTDATSSSVTTVGMLFTEADPAAMTALHQRFVTERLGGRTDLMPRTYPVKSTVAADFGDAQRASWTVSVLTDAPVVVYAVSGFADGRTVTDPEPADEAVQESRTTAAAQAGLGYEAKGIEERVERALRKNATATGKP